MYEAYTFFLFNVPYLPKMRWQCDNGLPVGLFFKKKKNRDSCDKHTIKSLFQISLAEHTSSTSPN